MKARAKRIDNGEVVEGYYDATLLGEVIHTLDGRHTIVDPQTIEYQIGTDWYNEEEIQEALVDYKTKMSKPYNGGYTGAGDA